MPTVIKFHDYLDKYGNASFAMRMLLLELEGQEDIVIQLDKETYHFYPDEALEASYNISNHGVFGYKRIAARIFEFNRLVVDGQNASLVFHGIINPFVIDRSSDISLENLSIMWENPMLVQAKVTAAGDGYIDIEPEGDGYYEICNRRVYLKGPGFREPLYDWCVIEMDTATGAPAYQSGDDSLRVSINALDAFMVSDNTVRLRGDIGRYPRIGNHLLLRGGKRYSPAIFIKDSSNVRLRNVNVFNAIGMAVIAQKAADISLDRTNVIPKPGSGRLFSADGDAAHFVNCRGRVSISDCMFTHQMDDALNIHGIYMQIVRKIDGHRLIARLVHHEQFGVDVLGAGDRVRFIRSSCLEAYAGNIVKHVEQINIERSIVAFEDPLPGEMAPCDSIENVTWTADLSLTNCTIRDNRARGLLISTGGKVEIAGNYISTPGAGILISGDANHWFESGAVNDVTIKNNIFENCTYVPQWGDYNILIHPEVPHPERARSCYHKNISITDNIFRTFTGGIVKARCTDGIRIGRNHVIRTSAYPDHNEGAKPFDLTDCKNIEIDDQI